MPAFPFASVCAVKFTASDIRNVFVLITISPAFSSEAVEVPNPLLNPVFKLKPEMQTQSEALISIMPELPSPKVSVTIIASFVTEREFAQILMLPPLPSLGIPSIENT